MIRCPCPVCDDDHILAYDFLKSLIEQHLGDITEAEFDEDKLGELARACGGSNGQIRVHGEFKVNWTLSANGGITLFGPVDQE
jgi:hypothetical protein